jgi:uncharacterized membrane protein (Fun14 family)
MLGVNFSQIALQVTNSTSTLVDLFGPAVAELGFGGIVGFAVGYALKKILKVLMILAGIFIGLELAFLYWLQSIGAITITVNYNALSSIGANAVAWGTGELGGLTAFASTISLTITGFAAGAALGFQKG